MRTDEAAWEIARPAARPSLNGVRMTGFRELGSADVDLHVLPQPTVVVIISLSDEPLIVEDAASRRRLRSFAAAMTPGAPRIRGTRGTRGTRVDCLELHLSPRAAYPLLGIPPRELDGSIAALEDLWGRPAQRLHNQLRTAATWRQRLALMDDFLPTRAARTAHTMTPEVAATWHRIVTHHGRIAIGDLATHCGWSRKRLWSRFSAQIGLTPKRAAMLVRFHHAARALSAGKTPADVATACGYVDQSHLHRDVMAFTGCTPATLANRTTTAT